MTSPTEARPAPTGRPQRNLDAAIEELRNAFETPKVEKPAVQTGRGGILDIPIELQIVLGRVEMLVAEILAIEENAVIPLDRGVEESVDIMANGRCVARGKLAVLDGPPARLAIQITEVAGG